MRKSLVIVLALVAFGSLSGAAWAGTIKLHATERQVEFACLARATDGQLNSGKGPGGYGCKTSKGEVSCTAAGECTGTCQACRARVITRGRRVPYTEILGPRTAGAKSGPRRSS
jgi:hypothetical protein